MGDGGTLPLACRELSSVRRAPVSKLQKHLLTASLGLHPGLRPACHDPTKDADVQGREMRNWLMYS